RKIIFKGHELTCSPVDFETVPNTFKNVLFVSLVTNAASADVHFVHGLPVGSLEFIDVFHFYRLPGVGQDETPRGFANGRSDPGNLAAGGNPCLTGADEFGPAFDVEREFTQADGVDI